MDLLFAIALGVGLAAACGFRIFVPLLGLSLAAANGHIELAAGFEWVGSTETVSILALATFLEIAAFYVPWVDNMLDTVASPAAVVAGTVATASVVQDMSPLMQWALAAIFGGGTAGIVQGGTTLLRVSSTTPTGGLGNAVVATGELAGAAAGTLLAIWVPLAAMVLAIVLCTWLLIRLASGRRNAAAPASARVVEGAQAYLPKSREH